MAHAPWWIDRAAALTHAGAIEGLPLGAVWRLREQLEFVRQNVEPAHLEQDFAAAPGARATWAAFERREADVASALTEAGGRCATDVRSGSLGPAAFRASWESLGFESHGDTGGTPADDYLDGLLHLSRYTPFATPAPSALLNLATRASRVADFLSVTEPGATDVVFDIGSGSGKLAITVGASAQTTVHGVEIDAGYAAESQRSSSWLGLGNVSFEAADVRDVDLRRGSLFYLYYPFHGRTAQTVAARLGTLAREKDITIYAAGPAHQYGEYFLSEVSDGALTLDERRGEFGEVMVLRSQR